MDLSFDSVFPFPSVAHILLQLHSCFMHYSILCCCIFCSCFARSKTVEAACTAESSQISVEHSFETKYTHTHTLSLFFLWTSSEWMKGNELSGMNMVLIALRNKKGAGASGKSKTKERKAGKESAECMYRGRDSTCTKEQQRPLGPCAP